MVVHASVSRAAACFIQASTFAMSPAAIRCRFGWRYRENRLQWETRPFRTGGQARQPQHHRSGPDSRRLMLSRFLIASGLLLVFLARAADPSQIDVRFEGISGAILDNVTASVTLNRQREREQLDESRIRFLHRRAPKEIRQALRVFGYYEPRIESELKQTEKGWQAHYVIEAGEPVTLHNIHISITGAGADDEAFKELRAEAPFKEGARLKHQKYSSYKADLQRTARERGYFEARFLTSELRVNPDKRKADILLEFETGPRYRFGPVSFNETPFTEEYLRNYIPFETGEPYTTSGPAELRQALINTDLFSTVNVRPREDKAEDRSVPVEVELEPRKPNRYTAGVGFATDTGPRLRLGWAARYLNERGHKFDTDLRLSPVNSSLTSTYLMPYFRNRPADVGMRASLVNEDTDTSESQRGEATLFQSRMRWGWHETLSTTYLVEKFQVADDDDTVKLLIPGASWWRSWTDDPIYAKRGGRLSLDLKGAAEPLLSDTSFAQARIQGKYVRALGFRNRILARLEFGATGVTDFSKLPASLRFFAGGDNSIRGYDYQALGPENADGEVTGGRYLIVGSIEYEQFVYKDYGVAAFVDFGNAVNDFSDPLEVGTGFGLRWLSPVGLIKADVGFGVTEDDLPIRLHLSIGSNL